MEKQFEKNSINLMKQDQSFETVQHFMAHLSDHELQAHLYAQESLSKEEQEQGLLEHLVVLLRSGFHPDQLSKEESDMLRKAYGKRWRTRFGYNEVRSNK